METDWQCSHVCPTTCSLCDRLTAFFLLIPLHVCLQPFSCFFSQYVIQEVRIMRHSGQLSTEWLDYVVKGDRYCHLKLSHWPDHMYIEVLGLTIEDMHRTKIRWLVQKAELDLGSYRDIFYSWVTTQFDQLQQLCSASISPPKFQLTQF